jgi:hypothetical protein
MELLQINILIFNFLCLLHVSNPGVHLYLYSSLQEDCYINKYATVLSRNYGYRGMLLTTHPLLVPRSWTSRDIPLPPLGNNRACNGVTFLYIYFLEFNTGHTFYLQDAYINACKTQYTTPVRTTVFLRTSPRFRNM